MKFILNNNDFKNWIYLSQQRTKYVSKPKNTYKKELVFKSQNKGISLKNVQLLLDDYITEYTYTLPKKLVDTVTKICQCEFFKYYNSKSKQYQNVYQNRLDQALYMFIAIKYFNYRKNNVLKFIADKEKIKEINFKYDTKIGNQLSKEILTNVISNRDLYRIKKLLIEHEMIGNVPLYINKTLDDNKNVISQTVSFYSKNKKQALHYFINPIYIDENEVVIKNRYADKHAYLLKHKMLFGNTKKCLSKDYLPYINDEKNIQYQYQKQMTIDMDIFKDIFLKKFPELNMIDNVYEKLEKNDLLEINKLSNYSEVIQLYKTFMNFNKHIFNAGEAYGRIFMPLQNIPKEFRKCIKYKDENLVELFDIKCCFVQLAGLLAFSRSLINKDEYIKLINAANHDIYSEILIFINDKNLTRNNIKEQILGWLFCTNIQREYNKNKVVQGISNYFKHNFEQFYNFVINYNLYLSDKLLKNKKKKIINKLSIDCFKYESKIMFNYILPALHKRFPDIPFFSLHDGILTTETGLTLLNKNESNIYNYINSLINQSLKLNSK